jgi:hypothetical protein
VAVVDPPDGVAALVEVEGLVELAPVFQRLAEREGDVGLVLWVAALAGDLGTHQLDVGVAEAEGLEVGQAPPGLAQPRVEIGALAVGRD